MPEHFSADADSKITDRYTGDPRLPLGRHPPSRGWHVTYISVSNFNIGILSLLLCLLLRGGFAGLALGLLYCLADLFLAGSLVDADGDIVK